MGMFDSFYLRDGREVQTKSLDNSLHSFEIGATCPNYEHNFDGPTGSYYLIEDTLQKDWVSIIIIDNVFVDYQIGTDYDQLKIQTECLFTLFKSYRNLLSGRLVDLLKNDINPKLTSAERKLQSIKSVLRTYESYLEDADFGSKRMFFTESELVEQFKTTQIHLIIKDLLEK
jgi:hypothetical protein